jgi:hypothetical protein
MSAAVSTVYYAKYDKSNNELRVHDDADVWLAAYKIFHRARMHPILDDIIKRKCLLEQRTERINGDPSRSFTATKYVVNGRVLDIIQQNGGLYSPRTLFLSSDVKSLKGWRELPRHIDAPRKGRYCNADCQVIEVIGRYNQMIASLTLLVPSGTVRLGYLERDMEIV